MFNLNNCTEKPVFVGQVVSHTASNGALMQDLCELDQYGRLSWRALLDNDKPINHKLQILAILEYKIGYSAEYYYLDWFNNFLTLDRFCDYYGINQDQANDLLSLGKTYNHN